MDSYQDSATLNGQAIPGRSGSCDSAAQFVEQSPGREAFTLASV
ncbi:hypothetical protein ABZX69_38620 [Streptomyces sp. NPDC004074]